MVDRMVMAMAMMLVAGTDVDMQVADIRDAEEEEVAEEAVAADTDQSAAPSLMRLPSCPQCRDLNHD